MISAATALPTTIVVVPCYNEAARLDTAAFARFAADHAGVQLLFVDDGSTDATPRLLAELAAASAGRIRCHTLPHNRGKAEAVRQGFLAAFATEPPADAVGFWDADLATPLADVEAFRGQLAVAPHLLAVFGARVNLLGRSVRRQLVRHYLGRVFATAVAVLLRLPIYDSQCGAKLLRATADVRAVFAAPFASRWIFDVEILARLGQRLRSVGGPPLAEVVFEYPLMLWRDVRGSKLRLHNFATVFGDFVRIWWRMRRGRV